MIGWMIPYRWGEAPKGVSKQANERSDGCRHGEWEGMCDGFRCSAASPGKPQHKGLTVKVTTLDTLLTGTPHSRFAPQLLYVPLHGVEAE